MTGTTQDLQGGSAPSWAPGTSLDDAQRLGHFGQNVCRAQKLLPLMGRAHYGAQPRFAFRHDRVTDSRREDAGLEEFLGEFERLRRVAHVNRNNRRLAHLELKTAPLQFKVSETP